MSATPDIIIDNIGGSCPVQAQGTINGAPFYFRARYQHWSIEIGGGKALNFTDSTLPARGFYMRQAYGEGPYDAGTMEQAEAIRLIEIAAIAYSEKCKPTIDATQLKDGFYWVKADGIWQVAKWDGETFWITAWEGGIEPHQLEDIDPRPIVREPSQ